MPEPTTSGTHTSVRLASLASFAASHHGLVTRQHAIRQGWSRTTWYRAIEQGDLVGISPKVARVATSPVTRENRILGPILSLGESAVASHRSGAYIWGVDCPVDDPVDLISIDRARSPEWTGVVIHRPTDLADLRIVVRRGIPTANPLRVLVDLGAVDPGRVDHALEYFVVSGLVSPAAAQAALDRHSRSGRHGAVALRQALDRWRLGTHRPDSVLEAAMARLLVTHRLPPATFHARLEGIEVDFHLMGTRLVIECDGWVWHGVRRDQFERDRERDAILGRAGYVVRRFTWTQIRERPGWVARMISDSLVWAR